MMTQSPKSSRDLELRSMLYRIANEGYIIAGENTETLSLQSLHLTPVNRQLRSKLSPMYMNVFGLIVSRLYITGFSKVFVRSRFQAQRLS